MRFATPLFRILWYVFDDIVTLLHVISEYFILLHADRGEMQRTWVSVTNRRMTN